MASHIVGYPRMGPKRELKIAQDSFGDWKSSAGDFQKLAADLGVEYVIDPEWVPPVKFSYASHKAVTEYNASHKAVTEYKEAKALGVDTVPVLGKDKLVVSALAGQKDEVIFSANAAALAPRKPSPRVTYEAVQKADAALKGSDHRRATNIHTHTFHSNFNDTVHSIIDMDDPWPILTQGFISAQMKEKWDKGLCFKCDHKWGPGQRCGGPQLFVFEETKGDRDLIDNTEEEIGKSPPAISRSPIPKPMMVKIMVNSHEYIALIDTGSTYNLLHPRVAREMGLEINKDDSIEVSIGDGSKMYSKGSCPEFKFGIQGGQFATQAYILQLGELDVILGIQWLMGLGDIKNWNFASLKMEFTHEGKTIQIKGMDTEESEAGCSTDEKLLSMVREGVKYGAGIVYDIHSPRVPSTEEIKYGAGIGPGVYDIHSPRVPSTEEIADGINKMLAVLKTIQVNPDCGLKTRKCTEVKPALKNKLLRSQLVSAK